MGTLNRSRRKTYQRTVHPHIRGDIPNKDYAHNCFCGSPPHTWGHFKSGNAGFKSVRFTPTYVGTFARLEKPGRPSPVHPHIRGDIDWARGAIFVTFGSPPHTWGHLLYVNDSEKPQRFTPTYVGTFGEVRKMGRDRTVHPHIRGDIFQSLRILGDEIGSPPHTWGHYHAFRMAINKSLVHPHIRGDIRQIISEIRKFIGSPPHTWGHFS